MVNVQRCILASLLLLHFGGKDNSRLGKKTIQITYRIGGEATGVLRINSLEKNNENNAIIFSSTFTFITFIFFSL